MKSAIIFSSLDTLDSREVRENVGRIPEVCAALTVAQQIWDIHRAGELNFYNFLSSDDSVFLKNIQLKTLVQAVVQVGLYRRFVKKFPVPQYLMGTSNGDSALKVCAEELSLEKMIENSQALSVLEKAKSFKEMGDKADISSSVLLSGMALSEYSIYKGEEPSPSYKMEEVSHRGSSKGKYPYKMEKSKGYTLCDSEFCDMKLVMEKVVESYGVKRLISIGPGQRIASEDQQDLLSLGIQVLESIELDPMLSWFWPRVHQDMCGRKVVVH